jgi:hypothetical protein
MLFQIVLQPIYSYFLDNNEIKVRVIDEVPWGNITGKCSKATGSIIVIPPMIKGNNPEYLNSSSTSF